MLMILGFRGVNLADPACIARTEGLDMMMVVVIFLAIKRLKRPAFVHMPKKLSLPSKLRTVKAAGESELALINTAVTAVGTPRY